MLAFKPQTPVNHTEESIQHANLHAARMYFLGLQETLHISRPIKHTPSHPKNMSPEITL
jgi:hypothetical protein